MPFVKYTRPKPDIPSSHPDVRLSLVSLIFTETGLSKFPPLATARYVCLFFDATAKRIGVAVADKHEPGALKLRQRGRSANKMVPVADFFVQFGLAGKQLKTDGLLREVDRPEMEASKTGYLYVFSITAKAISSAPQRKRRSRKPYP